jgi:phage-related protein
MSNKKHRKVVTYKSYFKDFIKSQPIAVKKKIIWTLELIEDLEHVPETYLKHLTGNEGLYEIRISLGSNIYRIFCFLSGKKFIILMNAFQKKTQKTPKSEILKALKLKEEYEQENK